MKRIIMCVLLASAALAQAQQTSGQDLAALFERVTPSLVAVQYTWEHELGRRDIIGAGVVVKPEGVVLCGLGLFNPQIPDSQMKDFKILVPRRGLHPLEVPAVFMGRDERNGTAFMRARDKQDWKAVQFQDIQLKVGDPVVSVGLLGEDSNYRAYMEQANVASIVREERRIVLASGRLAAVGSPVFDMQGRAVGVVPNQPQQNPLLNDKDNRTLLNPPLLFSPTKDFQQSLDDMPTPEAPIKVAWIGIPQQALTPLKKEVASYFSLVDTPAVEIGEIIPKSPAEQAGLKQGMIILKLNGEALESGDGPTEVASILRRKLGQLGTGAKVTLTVLPGRGEQPRDIEVQLEERPITAAQVARFFAEDTGLGVRDSTFYDLYPRRLPLDSKFAVISAVRQSSSAASAGVRPGDLVQDMNRIPVTDAASFKAAYERLRKDKPREPIVLLVVREGNTQTLRIEPPQ